MSAHRLTSFLLVLAATFVFAADLHAGFATPVYPAPGGNDWSGSGDATHGGGAVYSYSNFASADLLAGLYWGKDSTWPVYFYLGGTASSGDEMALTSITGNAARWTGASNMLVAISENTFVDELFPTRFTLTVTDPESHPINFSAPLPPEIPPAADAVVQVLGNYHANLLFEFQDGGNWYPVGDHYAALNPKPATNFQVDFGGAFYAVPEPASLTLLALGGLLLTRRRP